jgi:TPR repeat protein
MIGRSSISGALAVGLLFAAPAYSQSVKSGIEAWQRGDYSGAAATWRILAEAGDADAAFNLGQAYRLGRGVPLNLAASRTWLLRAASKDHLDAQATLGLLLFDNGDREGGLRWLRSAADRGDARSLLVYGTALFNGDGVKRDPVLAYAMISRAAAQGLAPAKTTLAEMDRILPLDQRKKGLAMAMAKAASKAQVGPTPVAARAKPVAAPATGAWRIQLGAFSQRASADALFKRLAAGAPVAGRQAFYTPAGSVTRLQVGPFGSRAAAAAACAALSKRGQACFPVPGR